MLHLLPQAVDRAADRAPDHEAVRCDGVGLTYGELASGSARLANVLAEQGVRRGDRVGIYAEKGLRTTMAMHGAMKAGAAYVPIDPAAPPARVELILRDCDIRHVVVDEARAGALHQLIDGGLPLDGVIGVDEPVGLGVATATWTDVDGAPATPSRAGTIELDLAYVLYTSGSTGVPKGVMHTHRSALSWAEVSADTWGFRPDDRISSHAPLYFDLSTLDYFAAAVAGATTIVVPTAYTRLPASFSQLIEDERMTVLFVVPLALTHMLLHGAIDQRELGSVRWILFGGEPFPVKHLRALMEALPDARFSNVYGPTEVNGITYHDVPPLADDVQSIPIGDPFPNVELIVVDETNALVSDADVGELLARTPTMMRGYWRRPDLDERAFWTRPAAGGYHEVFHRTGDLVRRRPDGLLEFLGRKDRQVKVRGHRVELDEVEAALTSHPAVESTGVFVLPTEEGSQRIVAAVTLRGGQEASARDLSAHAAEHLPRYALPEIDIVDMLPRTVTGKIDRRALREHALERSR